MAWDLFPLFKDKIALALFTLNFLDIRGLYEKRKKEGHMRNQQLRFTGTFHNRLKILPLKFLPYRRFGKK